MRDHLNNDAKQVYDRHVSVAIAGGCDTQQAHRIARERYLLEAAARSDAIRATRSHSLGEYD